MSLAKFEKLDGNELLMFSLWKNNRALVENWTIFKYLFWRPTAL
jgi:hypothetical protein